MLVERTAGTSRVETKQATQLGESNQVTLAGTIRAAMLQMGTRTGDLGLTMDLRAIPTIIKAGTHKARIETVLRRDLRIMANPGTSRAHTGIVLGGEVRIWAKIGTKKAQLVIVLTERTLGAGLQDPSQLLITPDPRATVVVAAGQLATAATPTITVRQATCQALGQILQDPNLGSPAVLTSLSRVGIIKVMAILLLPATTVGRDGVGRLDLKDHHFPPRVVIKAGEEGVTEAGTRQTIGTREAEAQEEDGTITHRTTLDQPPTRGKLT